MIVDLEDKEITGFFELKGGGKVHLRLLSIKDIRDIQKATMKTIPEYPLLKDADGKERYHRFEKEDVDIHLFNEMRFDRNIVGWDNLFDKNEKPIPVTKENKTLLMMMVPEFKDAVDNGLKALQDTEKERNEASIKNSLPG